MATRTTQTVVRFNSAFALPGLDVQQPPGDYRVDLDEEPLEPASLKAALDKDRRQS